jgi:NAD(P)-dependent dehydrogenase (short-subunit alcohol dehydrogenase family)
MAAPVLTGQAAIVTGAGRGIGKAIALRFAREGADVGVLEIDGETAAAVAGEIQALGRRAVLAPVDVSDPDAVNAAVTKVTEELGRLDVLVNNAGIEARAPFLEITPDDWRRQLDVNLSGTFFCTQAAAREMAKRGYGRIVNVVGRGPHWPD